MTGKLDEVIRAALGLTRSERAVVLERLRESLEQPDVPGGIIVEPADLVEVGARYSFPQNARYRAEVVTLTARPGPTLAMTWGAVAIADPWLPEAAPQSPAINLGGERHPTAVVVIARTRRDTGAAEVLPVAAVLGAPDQVASWQPLVADGQLQLYSDSSLGAFYDLTDAEALQPLFEDDAAMQDVFKRAMTESIVALEVGGRTLGAAYVCGKDLHPAWAGYDADGLAVAVLLDVGLLSHARGREAGGS